MSELELLNQFEDYLVKRGYSSRTPSGSPSTAYNYAHSRIPFVMKRERVSLQQLIKSIDRYLAEYDEYGIKSDFGKTSHNSVINALRRFKEFISVSKI